jgi:hypothetical protein
VSLRHDQLILINKAVNKKYQLEKGLKEEEEKKGVGVDSGFKGCRLQRGKKPAKMMLMKLTGRLENFRKLKGSRHS